MEKLPLNLLKAGTKAQSKWDLYRVLTVEGKMYLPSEREAKMDFISAIACLKKKVLFANDVTVCQVPYVKGLRSLDLIQFLIEECDAKDYLPDDFDDYVPNRTWLGNLCNSLGHQKFQEYIVNVLSKREEKLIKKNNLVMEVGPNFAKIIENSQMIAVKKGRSHMLLRKALIKEKKDKESTLQREKDRAYEMLPQLLKEVEELKEEVMARDHEIDQHKKENEICRELFDRGLIDEDGNVIS